MNRFLSEENIALHREYVKGKRLKYSIIESSLPQLKGKEIRDIHRMKISLRDKCDAVDLMSEIRLHDIFFSSFSDVRYPRCQTLVGEYGSEANFLNLLYRRALAHPYGFLLVYAQCGRVEIDAVYDFPRAFEKKEPTLAIDVCEHSYFMDYGFDKERYLVSMLPYLDIAKLSACNT